MISQADGQYIKDFMNTNKNNPDLIEKIHLSIDFEMVAKRTARVDLFYTSTTGKVYDLLEEFSYYQDKFEHKDIIVPHLISNSDENKLSANCIGEGAFCEISERGISSETIIFENVRQMCVYNLTADHKGEEKLYWKYMLKFKSWCLESDFTKTCAENILDKFLPDHADKIKSCVSKSFTNDNKNNTILQNERDNFKKHYQLHLFPSILVNYRVFFSSWTPENLLEAVCSGVIQKPRVCFESGLFSRKRAGESTGMSVFYILLLILLIIMINVVIYFCCRRYITKSISDRVSSEDIDSRINNVVSSYIAFKDQNQNKLLDGQSGK